MTNRPAESLTALVAAVLAVLVAFEVKLTEEQVVAVIGLVGALPAVVTWVVEWRRRREA